jgi:V/A-type H+/Na+-transporting ATPase subunit D
MAEEINPTRTELLARKNQIALAEQGRDLLSQKRDALIMEFMQIVDAAVDISDRLQEASRQSYFALAVANSVDGSPTLKSVAMATRGEVDVDISGSYIMGVPVANVEKKSVKRSAIARGYSITGVSSRVSEVAARFEHELDVIIEFAAVETRLKRLGSEIQATRRRVNALDYIVIPQAKEQLRFIEMALEERAREDLFRLKKVKKSINARKSADSVIA